MKGDLDDTILMTSVSGSSVMLEVQTSTFSGQVYSTIGISNQRASILRFIFHGMRTWGGLNSFAGRICDD